MCGSLAGDMRLVIWKKRRRIEPQAGTVCGSTRLAGADLPLMTCMGEVGRQVNIAILEDRSKLRRNFAVLR
jgi:hypothetical protein